MLMFDASLSSLPEHTVPAGCLLQSSLGVTEMVDQMVRYAEEPSFSPEKRTRFRRPFPQLLRVTPVQRDGLALLGDPIDVVGKQISPEGLGFFHSEPLPHRYVIAHLRGDRNEPTELLLDLVWCRFLREGKYDSGGRFVRVVTREERS